MKDLTTMRLAHHFAGLDVQGRKQRSGAMSYAWIVKSAALVNQYYFYCLDRDFGPFFLKFCSYFPF